MRLSWHRRSEYAVFFDYSAGRVRPLPRGFPRGGRQASGGGYSERRVKTRWIRALGAPKRVKNAYDRGTPHGAVGKDFSPRDSWALHPGPRAAKLRVWGPFWRNLAGSAPGNAPWAVGENFCPTASGGVRAPGSRARGANSVRIYVFSRRARPAPGPRNPHSGPAPGAPGAAGPERAPRVAPQEARSARQPEG